MQKSVSEDSSPVVVTRHGGVLLARMDAVAYRNALSVEMKRGLAGVAQRYADDASLRCLVLTGTDAVFCAGGDLRDMSDERSAQAIRTRMELSHRIVRTLAACEKPVLTAVNGAAVGAGLSLALLGDLVVARDDAYFMPGFSRVGVLPDLGLLYHLPRAIGMPRANELLMTNRRVAAPEALQMGLVSRVLPAAGFMDEVLALADGLAQGPTVALGLGKVLADAAWREDLASYLHRETLAQAAVFGTDDFMEGTDAFKHKRPPVFSGR